MDDRSQDRRNDEETTAGRSLLHQEALFSYPFSAAVCLLQGAAVALLPRFFSYWPFLYTLALLPCPFYLSLRGTKRRAAVAALAWGALLLFVDFGWFVHKGGMSMDLPQNSLFGPVGVLAAALLLPYAVSYIEEGVLLPPWKKSFSRYSTMFFVLLICLFFSSLFQLVMVFGSTLLNRIGFDGPAKIVRSGMYWRTSYALVGGLSACWAVRRTQLLELLRRYILRLVSFLLPLFSLFMLLFTAMLPMGVDRLWARGFDSSLVLLLQTGMIVLTIVSWQGGEGEDGTPRQPFVRPVGLFVQCAIAVMPVLSCLLAYTLGLRIAQYGWTAPRIMSAAIALAYGLLSLCWSFGVVARRGQWPALYAKTTRYAVPLFALFLLLLVSPVGDARRFALKSQVTRFYAAPLTSYGRSDFWGFAGNYGTFGYETLKKMASDEGAAQLKRALAENENAAQADAVAGQFREAAQTTLADVERTYGYLSRRAAREEYAARESRAFKEQKLALVTEELLAIPVYGGELSEAERRALAQPLLDAFQWFTFPKESRGERAIVLADLDRDGVKETLFYNQYHFYIVTEGRTYRLVQENGVHDTAKDGQPFEAHLASGDFRVKSSDWDQINVGGVDFFVDPRY